MTLVLKFLNQFLSGCLTKVSFRSLKPSLFLGALFVLLNSTAASSVQVHFSGSLYVVQSFNVQSPLPASCETSTQFSDSPTHIIKLDQASRQCFAGGLSTVCVLQTGEVVSFGRNEFGQLGQGDTNERNIPTRIAGLSGVRSCSMELHHTICVLETGAAVFFGKGTAQNGDGIYLGPDDDHRSKLTPTIIPGLSGVRSCSLCMYTAVCVLETGAVMSFGFGESGELGHGEDSRKDTPTIIAGLSGVRSCSSSGFHTVCVLESGNVTSFGQGANGRLGHGDTSNKLTPTTIPGLSGVRSCSAGSSHTVCVLESGNVTSFGRSEYGQLGHGDTSDKLTPTTIAGLSGVRSCSAGFYNTICVFESGGVTSFGQGGYGQLGHGDTSSTLTPTTIAGLSGVRSCSAGQAHTVCDLDSNAVTSFGLNFLGQLGHGYTSEWLLTPTTIAALSGVRSCSAGKTHVMCLLEFGAALSFGTGEYGQLGHGDTSSKLTPTIIAGLSGVRSCSAGSFHTVCVLESGNVTSFGGGEYGQLGHGDTSYKLTPTTIPGLSGVRSCSAGAWYTVCVLESGNVTSFGYGNRGQLGHGDTSNKLTPATIPGLSGVRSCSAGETHVICVLESGGGVTSFGGGEYGQLGHGDTSDTLTPTTIPGLSGVRSCSAGSGHTMCVLESGNVTSFGYGNRGQLGHGDTSNKLTPATIPGLSGVRSCSAGFENTVCVLESGNVTSFGFGYEGQLGHGDTSDKLTPTTIPGLGLVVDASAGTNFSIYLNEGRPGVRADASGTATPCGAGEYLDSYAASSKCKVCPIGRYTNLTGLGYDENDFDRGCSACQGELSNVPSRQATESQCECLGFFEKNSTNPRACVCPKGTFLRVSGGSRTCETCAPGLFQDSENLAAACLVCNRGYFQRDQGADSCIACPAGQFQNTSGTSFCEECSSGKFQNQTSQISCIRCDGDSISTPRASVCLSCDAGSTPDSKQSQCVRCTSGWYSPQPHVACKACAPGSVTDTLMAAGATTCAECGKGKYSKEAMIRCIDCAAGHFGDESGAANSSRCKPCVGGKYSALPGSDDASDCITCDAGSVIKGGSGNITISAGVSCSPCTAGWYSPQPHVACKACAPGSVTDTLTAAGATTCAECGKGKYSKEATIRCIDCAAGKHGAITTGARRNDSTSCEDCPSGHYLATSGSRDESDCIICSTGFYQEGRGETSCVMCSVGRFANESAALACVECAAGKFVGSNAAVSCMNCFQGTASRPGAHDCLPCPPGMKCPAGTPVGITRKVTKTTTTMELVGLEEKDLREDMQLKIRKQLAAKFGVHISMVQLEVGAPSSSTRRLAAGLKFSFSILKEEFVDEFAAAVISKDETLGPANATLNKTNATLNETDGGMPKDTVPLAPSSTTDWLTEVLSATFNSTTEIEISKVVEVAPLVEIISSTDKCSAGRYADATTQSQCVDCLAGRYAPFEGSSRCLDCEQTKYQPDAGRSTCLQCETCKFGEREQCTGATPGFCPARVPCAPGKFETRVGVDEARCEECPSGYITTDLNAPSCSACGRGTYQGERGKNFCSDCNAVREQESTTSQEGAISEMQCICKPGNYLKPKLDDMGALVSVGDSNKSLLTCHTCPDEADCSDANSTLETLATKSGFWRAHITMGATAEYGAPVFYPCRTSNNGCLGSGRVANRSASDTGKWTDLQCAVSHTGPECKACNFKAGYVTKLGGCEQCSEGEGQRTAILFFVGIAFVVSLPRLIRLFFVRVYPNRAWPGWHVLSDAIQLRSTKSRITLGFIQVLTRMDGTFDLNMPQAIVTFFQRLAFLEFVDIFALGSVTMNCLQTTPIDYLNKIQVQSVGALAVAALLAFLFAAWRSHRTVIMDLALVFSFVIYPSMMALLFTYYGCDSYEDGKKYLKVDTSIRCNEERYDAWAPVVAILIVIFVIGIPASYLFLLWPVRKVIKPKTKAGLNKYEKPKEQLRIRDQMVAKHKAIDAFFDAKGMEAREVVLKEQMRPLFEKMVTAAEDADHRKLAERKLAKWDDAAKTLLTLHVETEIYRLTETDEPSKQQERQRETPEEEATDQIKRAETEKQGAVTQSETSNKENLLRLLVTMRDVDRPGVDFPKLVKQYALEERAMQMAFLWAGYMPSSWYLEIVEMTRKFLLTGVPLILQTYVSDPAVDDMYGTLVVAMSSMLYAGTNAYRSAADRLLMIPTQFVLVVTMATGSMMNAGGGSSIVTPIMFIVCIPTLLALAYALIWPEYVDRVAGEDPLFLLKPILEPMLKKRGLEWDDVQPLLADLSMEELEEGLEDPVELIRNMLRKAGPGGKLMMVSALKPLLERPLKQMNTPWETVEAQLDNMSLKQMEAAFDDPEAFVERLAEEAQKSAAIAMVKPALMPLLNEKGFEWEFFKPLLEGIETEEDVQAAVEDPQGWISALAEDEENPDPVAQRMVAIMVLQEGMEEAVKEAKLTWKEAVRVFCQMEDEDTGVEELVSMEELEEAQQDCAPLIQTILANRIQIKLKRSRMKIRGLVAVRNSKVAPLSTID